VERILGSTSLVDVLDRVLDKGVVVESWLRVALVAIDLLADEARLVVDTSDTGLKGSNARRADAEPVADDAITGARLVARRRDDDDGSGGSGSGACAGTADLLPRRLPAGGRRPID
jgi:gas vesicle structural protein